ncbi:hypothetical protein BJX64DRAFT_91258 [Aspergillus heterothallicus]
MQLADGWTIHAASEQSARRGAEGTARALGRQLSATPEHLSRVLYFPWHDGKTAHVPLYEVSSRYAAAVRDTAMGSGKYTVALGMMSKPDGGGGEGGEVCYLVDFDFDFAERRGRDAMTGRVRRRAVPGEEEDVEAEVTASDDEVTVKIVGEDTAISVATTYPIPPSQTALGLISHPYFGYKLSSGSEAAQFQWEIHPVEDGPLRYTLVRSPLGDSTADDPQSRTEADTAIEAIYHHIGIGMSLSQTYSEGVLLLPRGGDSRAETAHVASLLGMLWRLRRMDGAGTEGGGSKRRLDGIKKLLKRG